MKLVPSLSRRLRALLLVGCVAGTIAEGQVVDPPMVVNQAATEVGFAEATLNGSVLSTGGEAPEVTIYFGVQDGGMDPGSWDEAVTLGSEAGDFSNSVFFLQADTPYFFRAYAENSGGGSWAPDSATFQTLAYVAPVVTNLPASEVSGRYARVGGAVSSTGGDAPQVTVYFGLTDGGTAQGNWQQNVAVGPQSGEFSVLLTGLVPEATYFFRVFGENAGGAGWAPESATFTTAAASEVLISEFMASNDGGATNNINRWWPIANQVPGTADDWIEITNSGAAAVDLGGWHLTDDPGQLQQWTFPPNTILDPGAFLIVYASGDNAPDANGNLHTNFSLAAEGEYLALVAPGGAVASEFGVAGTNYPGQDRDVSFGLHPNRDEAVYFARPTPGAANDASGIPRVGDTKFSPDRGYYQAEIEVTITAEPADARIYYTLDGMPPVDASGRPINGARAYTAPIPLRRTTPLRAAAVKPGFTPSNIDTHTYIILDIDGAAANGSDPAGLNTGFQAQRQPSGWGSLPSGDYNMDPSVSRSTSTSIRHDGLTVAQAMLKGMRDIPTVSLALDRNDFAGSNGIYSNPESRGSAWERPCSAEFIPALDDEKNDWGENCGLRVQGGASRIPSRSPKHSLSLRFRDEYGVGKLRQDVFPGSPVREFNVLSLRAGYNNSWIHSAADQRMRGSMIRDQWARDTMLDMGHDDAGRGYVVHLFVNGLYWGVHTLCERQDASHYAAYNGGDEDQLDARNGSDFIDGTSSAWSAMQSVVSSRNWRAIQEVLDVDTYIDYQIVNRYGGNADLKTNGNWRAAGGGPFPAGQPTQMAAWKLYSWDAERILESPTSTTEPLDPMAIRNALDSIPEYRLRFGDRLQKHFFNGGALTPEACRERWMRFATPLDRAIIAESARWGDHRRSQAYSRNVEWLDEQSRLMRTYFPVRAGNVLNRYRSQGFYPTLGAPVFRVDDVAQHGGEIPMGSTLSIAGSGTIHYTLDGSDPRLEGGAINPNAIEIMAGEAVVLADSGLVRMRARSGTTWSALVEATFYVEPLATAADLLLSEVNYHPAPASAVEREAAAALPVPRAMDNPDDFEFVEIRNISPRAVNLDGVEFTRGIGFTFPPTVLEVGAFVVLVRDPEAFGVRYPGIPVGGVYTGNLANDGERLSLQAPVGGAVIDFVYADAGEWPSRADGLGSTLEATESTTAPALPGGWRASSEFHGTPGSAGSGPDRRVVINEVLSRTMQPAVDRIELHNRSGSEVDVSGWLLSDRGSELKSYRIPAGPPLPAGGYLVVDENDFNPGATNAVAGYSGSVAAAPTMVRSPGHGLATGNVVTIDGYGGIGSYNGTFQVTVVDQDSFSIETAYLDDDVVRGNWVRGRPFALDGVRGDSVWLVEADAAGEPVRFVDVVSFDGADEGVSLGRWPNGEGSDSLVSMTATTFAASNAGPHIGSVIISEVMYHPGSPVEKVQCEFVELCNAGRDAENLENWRLRGGADFDFTAALELAPGEVLVIVPFDPQVDQVALAEFRSTYGIDASVRLVGPFRDGPLRNDTGTVRLQRAGQTAPEEPNTYPRITVDEVMYDAGTPWPVEAAGGGASLQRFDLAGFGNFAASWGAGVPNPGDKADDYSSWRLAFFGPGEPPGSGPFEDFELDGVLNLVEFALGMNPLVSDPDRLPGVVRVGEEIVFTYPRDTRLAGITLHVEQSADLVTWQAVPDEVVWTDGVIEHRRVVLRVDGGPRMFLRLVVSE